MNKRWMVAKNNDVVINQLQTALGIHPSLCKLLSLRNITSFNEAELFFRPQLEHLLDPYIMKDMNKAVVRILLALKTNQKILLYGDYDVDGTTAVAVVYNFLAHYTNNLSYYVPDRFSEGYGVSEKGIQFAIDEKVELLITLDCGIKSIALINKANEHNIDVIICDHHFPEETVPKALAILNPKQVDCSYPFKELCGCGIGFKLICALEQELDGVQIKCYDNLDLVAAAIAADIVPIVSENRIIATYGLKKANTNPSIPIAVLRKIADLTTDFTINDLVFIIAPRVNAAGRMNKANTAIDLFISRSESTAMTFAKELNINNEERRDVDKQITHEAIEMLATEDQSKRSTVLFNANWHKGVVGIVASRMIENKYQPTIVLTLSNDKISGSARSIPGFNLFEGLSECKEYLETFGGHYFAAGLTMLPEHLDNFKIKFDKVVKACLTEEDFIPQLNIDAEIELDIINEKFYNIIEQFEPFGPENMRPVFKSNNVVFHAKGSYLVKDKHLKLLMSDANSSKTIKGVAFNLGEKLHLIQGGKPCNIAYTIVSNEWRGFKTVELRVADIELAK
jgi:single-stranded-DNA-specific exonuclease